ncbi:ABC transporter substrate-binding protein [Mameliella alba]|uniref:ABC transporter substrate-binding protein n=1 Tax=Mameliella alba TaxID=561184 RepID=UPI000B5343A8|nr:ABC transporter substrate-binding protein [Mameliella alba]MBY6118677.1 ABC transporter substrate-binding protein [Mameliella alba]OWV41050.1 peptide ABC transporter [Mameliella alba]OWV68206.1 peptide ABC transporter [Mameliella alba]
MKNLLAATALAALTALPAAAQDDKVAITVNAVQIFGTIDPAKINDYTEYMAAVNLYDALTTVDAAGNVIPQLAESWDISDDSLTYTFHLKDGATFSDGTPVDAQDILYSIRRLLAINEGPSYLFSDLIDAESVTAPDDRTVVITLNKVYAPFISITPLLLAVNEEAVQTNGDDPWGETFLAETPAGAGPYTLSSWDRGAQMTLVRNEAYHGGWPNARPIDEVRFVVTRDEATVRALAQRGDLGISSQYQSTETYEGIAKLDDYVTLTTPTATGLYIKLNNQVPPTDDVHVRRAIAMAMDYATVREVIYPGAPLRGPLSDIFAAAVPEDAAEPVFDIAAAQAELAKSKYAGQGPIQLTHTYVSKTAFEEEIALLLKSTLDMIGFDVTIQPEPWNRITDLATSVETTPHTTQVFYGPTYPSPDSVFYVQYASSAAGNWASMDWVQDPEIDRLIEVSRAETDTAKRNGIYQDIYRKLVDDQRSVWLLAQERRFSVHKCLKGYEWVPMQSWDFDFSRMSWSCE